MHNQPVQSSTPVANQCIFFIGISHLKLNSKACSMSFISPIHRSVTLTSGQRNLSLGFVRIGHTNKMMTVLVRIKAIRGISGWKILLY